MATTEPSLTGPGVRDPGRGSGAVSSRELTRGLMLLRASNMNVIRLQLAMEQRDRRQAMEALDGLVALDGEIRDFIEDMPPKDAAAEALGRRIDAQKTAIASEKFILAAGKRGPALAPAPPPPEPAAPEVPDFIGAEVPDETAPAPGHRRAVVAVLLFFLLMAAVAAILSVTGVLPLFEGGL